MNTTPPPKDQGMPDEIDFSEGTRGKFYRPNAKLNLPVYLEADVQDYLGRLAARKGGSLSDLTNDLLKKEIAIIEGAKERVLRRLPTNKSAHYAARRPLMRPTTPSAAARRAAPRDRGSRCRRGCRPAACRASSRA